jgi:DNA-directed RNA polymerase subunit RPC12/RpoP
MCSYDCEHPLRSPHILPGCGHTFCFDCIEQLVTRAESEDADEFACPTCNHRVLTSVECPANWALKSTIRAFRAGVPSPSPSKRKRQPAVLQPPVAQDKFCPRHAGSPAEVLCLHCAELVCLSCAFDCGQLQHKCTRLNAQAVALAVRQSVIHVDAAFQLGKERIDAQLEEEIRKKRVAAEVLHRKLDSVCLDTKAKAEEEFKVRFQLALDTKDTAQLCELLEGTGDLQAYDVDVGNDIIVRCHRKIVYPNGTVYTGFVDTATGLADGEGTVTWGASAGRCSRKCYTGQFSAGLTTERLKFTWKEQRVGQAGMGHHSYIGTVEVMRVFVACVLFGNM